MITGEQGESSDEDPVATNVKNYLRKKKNKSGETGNGKRPYNTFKMADQKVENSDEDSVEKNIKNYLLTNGNKDSCNVRSSNDLLLDEYKTDIVYSTSCESLLQYDDDDDLPSEQLKNASITEIKKQRVTSTLFDSFHCLPRLHKYVCKGRKVKVLKYLAEMDNVKKINKKDSKGRTALHLAAAQGHVDILRILLSASETRVDENDNKGRTALFEAANHGCIECLQLLLYAGADCQHKNNQNQNVLEDMVSHGNQTDLNCFQFLFHEFNIFVHMKNGLGRTLLHLTAASNGCELMECLLEWGACVDEQDIEGRTPLILAVLHKHEKAADILLNNDADTLKIDNYNKNAFHYIEEGSGMEKILSKSSRKAEGVSKKCSICHEISQKEDLEKIKKERDEVIKKTHDIRKENQLMENQIRAFKKSDEVKCDRTFSFKKFRRKSSRLLLEDLEGDNSIIQVQHQDMLAKERSKHEQLIYKNNEIMKGNNEKCDEIKRIAKEAIRLSESRAMLIKTCNDLKAKQHEYHKEVVAKSDDLEMDYYEYQCGKLETKLTTITRKYKPLEEKLKREVEEYDQEITKLQSSLENVRKTSQEQAEILRELSEQERQQNEEIAKVFEGRNKLQAKYEKLRQICIVIYEETNKKT